MQNKQPKTIEQLIQEDVDRFIIDQNPAPLLEKLNNGVNLSKYEASKQLITNLLLGNPVRKKGKQTDRAKEELIKTMLIYVAQYYGAGLPLISKSDTAIKENYAINKVCSMYNYANIKPNSLYDHWQKHNESELVLFYIEFGKTNKDFILSSGAD